MQNIGKQGQNKTKYMAKPFENTGKKIPFEEIVELINKKCDYQFAVISEEIDDELMEKARKEGVDLTGYKHVMETSGNSHSLRRHGIESNDRSPISVQDFLLIPYIIKYRDKVTIPKTKTKQHGLRTVIYRKTIGDVYFYVEEIRNGRNKSLAFHSFYKRPIKKASQ